MSTRGSSASAMEDAVSVERRRVEYLRRHREALQQKLRLETEGRVQEWGADRYAICQRDAAVRSEKATGTLNTDQQLPGTYAAFDDLDAETLQRVAEHYGRRELAPLNTSGKYNMRYMKDRYPIAGTQLKLQQERDMYLRARKKLLLDAKTRELAKSREMQSRSGSMRSVSYSKLDYHIDSLTSVLERDQEIVRQQESERQLRMVEVQNKKSLEEFWHLISTDSKREAVAWLRSHEFIDVNVPVRVTKPKGGKPLAVTLDRDFGITPLMLACSLLNVKMVSCLLEHGSFVALTTGNGDTALHFVWKGWPATDGELSSTASLKDVAELALKAQRVFEILELLVAQGADANAQNAFGETSLQFCARFGLVESAKLLLAHGGDPFTADRLGKSAVQYAHEHNHDDLHRTLLNYAVIDRVRTREGAKAATAALLREKRGLLTASWSQPPEALLASLAVGAMRVGRLRNQYVDRNGNVIVCLDDE